LWTAAEGGVVKSNVRSTLACCASDSHFTGQKRFAFSPGSLLDLRGYLALDGFFQRLTNAENPAE